MKVLITGITGFIGSHLANYLRNNDELEIYGICRNIGKPDLVDYLPDGNEINLIECDMGSHIEVEAVLASVKPDIIFHLAGQSSVAYGYKNPRNTLQDNIFFELNIFQACLTLDLDPIILISGSSDAYGFVDKFPIVEDQPLRPLTSYGVSKACQDMLSFQYFKTHCLKVIRTRTFNISGYGKRAGFADSDFAKQIAMIEAGIKEPVIYVGNLDTSRDFMDVKDVVKDYWAAVNVCEFGEAYNICTSRPTSISEILKYLLSLSKCDIEVVQDISLKRKTDFPIYYGDNSKFINKIKRNCEYVDIKSTLNDLLSYWRNVYSPGLNGVSNGNNVA